MTARFGDLYYICHGPSIWHLDTTQFICKSVLPSAPYLVLGYGRDLSPYNFSTVQKQSTRRSGSRSTSQRSSVSSSQLSVATQVSAESSRQRALDEIPVPNFSQDGVDLLINEDKFRPRFSADSAAINDSAFSSGPLRRRATTPVLWRDQLASSFVPQPPNWQMGHRLVEDDRGFNYFQVPWCDDEKAAYVQTFNSWAQVLLPPYTDVVGFCSGTQAFIENSMEQFIFARSCSVFLPGEQIGTVYNGATGIIFPKSYQSSCRVICRAICSFVHPPPSNHYLSAGISLSNNCHVYDSISAPNLQEPVFLLTSRHHHVELLNRHPFQLHAPYKLPRLPDFLKIDSNSDVRIQIRSKMVPLVFLGFSILLFLVPGIIQYYLGTDTKPGDVINETISTGSVLLGLVIYVFREVFGPVFSWDSVAGVFSIKNNFVAHLFARDEVRAIEKAVCDPRLPTRLVKECGNSTVRTEKNGWLKVGQKVMEVDLESHGYTLDRDRGVVLDRVKASFYRYQENCRTIQLSNLSSHNSPVGTTL